MYTITTNGFIIIIFWENWNIMDYFYKKKFGIYSKLILANILWTTTCEITCKLNVI